MAKPPYGIIWNRMKTGRVVPFLGAGASIVRYQSNARWDPNNPSFLPSGIDLANFLADEAEFPSKDPRDREDLAKVSSYYEVMSGRTALRERLRGVLKGKFKTGALHKFLATVPTHQVIVATNYDTLLEQAFRNAGKPYDLVVYDAEPKKEFANTILWWEHGATDPKQIPPNELDIDLSRKTVIYKIHGTITFNTRVC